MSMLLAAVPERHRPQAFHASGQAAPEKRRRWRERAKPWHRFL
jgi:hypothetical protein